MRSPELGSIRVALTGIVAGDDACASRGVAVIDGLGAQGWDDAINLAVGWGLTGTLRERLGHSPLPPEAREKLRGASLVPAVRSTFVVHRSTAALRLLTQADVDAVAINGVGLIAALKRDPAVRTTSDLDVVVRASDAERARRILIAAGYRDISPPFERHMRQIALSRQLHNFARALERDGFKVDLHWQFGPNPPFALGTDRMIARAMTANLGTDTVYVADPVDAVLISVHRALRGSFAPHNMVRNLCDLRLWGEHGGIEARLDELLDAATRSGLAPSLLALWGAILRRDAEHGLRAGYERLERVLDRDARREAMLLERYFEDQLVHGTPARLTLEVFAPGVFVRSIAGTLVGALRPAHAQPGSSGDGTPRRPLLARIAQLGPRSYRVLRDLTRAGRIRSYRAVARAQSRFH